MKKTLNLSRKTLKTLDLRLISGGSSDTTDPCAVSRGFTNCSSCHGSWTALGTSCLCPDVPSA